MSRVRSAVAPSTKLSSMVATLAQRRVVRLRLRKQQRDVQQRKQRRHENPRPTKAGRYQQDAEQSRVARLARAVHAGVDRKSTRLNSSHLVISYAVFCLK